MIPIPTSKGGTPNRLNRSRSSNEARARATGATNVIGLAATLCTADKLKVLIAPGIIEKPSALRPNIDPVSIATPIPIACP